AGRAADREFHDALLRAAHNEVMMSLAASISSAVNWTTIYKQRSRALPRDPVPDHVRVFDAIVEGDADKAAQAMQALVDLAHEDVIAARAGWHGAASHLPQQASCARRTAGHGPAFASGAGWCDPRRRS